MTSATAAMSASPGTVPVYGGHISGKIETMPGNTLAMTGFDGTKLGTAQEERHGAPLALVVICVGYFLVILDATVVNVAIPSIGRDLGGGVPDQQWVIDAYTLSFAGLLLTGGALAERLGGRRVFRAGLVLFTLSSAVCGLAPTLGMLIGARLVQGVGAALLVPSSLVLLQAAYPTREGRSRAFGIWGAIAGIGAATGPIIGGLLVAWWSWRGVFFVGLPFALAALVLTGHVVPITPRRARALDLGGQLLGVAGLGLLTGSLVEAGRLGWGSPAVLVGFTLSLIALAGFVMVEHRSSDPMLPLALFSQPSFRSGSSVGLLINLGLYGQLFVMSLYFQDIRGYSALETGIALLPEAGLLIVASTLSGRIMARSGPRAPMLIGLLVGGVGLLGMASAGAQTPYVGARGPPGCHRLRDGPHHARGDGIGDGGGTGRSGWHRLGSGQRRPPVRKRARGRSARHAGGRANNVHHRPSCWAGHRSGSVLCRRGHHLLRRRPTERSAGTARRVDEICGTGS